MSLIVLVLCTSLSLIAAWMYIRKYRHNQRFSLNAVYVVLIFAVTWVLPAIIHFLTWKEIQIETDNAALRAVFCT